MVELTARAEETSDTSSNGLHLCIYATEIKERLKAGEYPKNPFSDKDCYSCMDDPEKQSGISCRHYVSKAHKNLAEKVLRKFNLGQ